MPASRSTAKPCSANGSATTTRLRDRPVRIIGRSCTRLLLRLHGTRAVAIAFAVPLVVLLASVRTSVGFWDAGDLQTVVWIAGIPYPTGFPGYVLIGWVWTHVLPFGSVAARINALSAVSVACGAATITARGAAVRGSAARRDPGRLDVRVRAHGVVSRDVCRRAPAGIRGRVRRRRAGRALGAARRSARARARDRARRRRGRDRQHDRADPVRRRRRSRSRGAGRCASSRAASPSPSAIVVAAYAYLPLRSAYVTAHRLDPTLALGHRAGAAVLGRPPSRDARGIPLARRRRGVGTGRNARDAVHAARVPPSRGPLRLLLERRRAAGAADRRRSSGWRSSRVRSPAVGLGLRARRRSFRRCSARRIRPRPIPAATCSRSMRSSALGIAVAADRTARAFGRERPALALAIVAALLSRSRSCATARSGRTSSRGAATPKRASWATASPRARATVPSSSRFGTGRRRSRTKRTSSAAWATASSSPRCRAIISPNTALDAPRVRSRSCPTDRRGCTATARTSSPPAPRKSTRFVRAVNAVLAGLLGAVAALAVAHGRVSPYDNYVLLASSLLHGHIYIDALWPGCFDRRGAVRGPPLRRQRSRARGADHAAGDAGRASARTRRCSRACCAAWRSARRGRCSNASA